MDSTTRLLLVMMENGLNHKNIVQFVFESIPGQREISIRIITSNISMEWIKFDETQFFNREDKG